MWSVVSIAVAYDKAAVTWHKELATLNFPDGPPAIPPSIVAKKRRTRKTRTDVKKKRQRLAASSPLLTYAILYHKS